MTGEEREGLPTGWVETTFGELNRYLSSNIDPADFSDETFELYSVPNFPKGVPEFQPGEAIGSTKQRVQPDDVLVCKINPRINRVWKVGEAKEYRQIGSSEWIVFRSPEVYSNFYKHYFRGAEFRDLLCTDLTGVGGSLTRAQPSKVATFPVPLPPLAEQVRIADKLDALLARVEAGRERLERVPKLLKRFRQSVLSAAVSGELTREWREEEAASWTDPNPLSQFTELDVGYAFKSADFSTDGVRLLRGDNIEPGRLRWRDAKCMPPEKLKGFEAYTIRPGDVILAMDRPIISSGLKIARATEQDAPSMLVQRVCRFKPKPDLDPGFLFTLLRSHDFSTYLGDKQNGTQVPHISAKQILGFAVSVPDLNEQAEIVRRVESLFAIADRIEAKYAAALSSFDRLTPALLAKAFRGELVPQDPNDEPASVLLERIRAAREAEGGKRGRGRPAKAAAGSGDGAEVKRRGRPPRANAQAETEGTEPKRRGRPPKVREAVSEPAGQPAVVPEAVEASAAPRGRGRPPGPGIPQASSFEDALRKLEEQKLARAQGARQVGLFDDAE